MSDSYVVTTHCDETGCDASRQRTELLDMAPPEGWQHVPARDAKKYYMSSKAKDFCPEHRR